MKRSWNLGFVTLIVIGSVAFALPPVLVSGWGPGDDGHIQKTFIPDEKIHRPGSSAEGQGRTMATVTLPPGLLDTSIEPVPVEKTTTLLNEGFEGTWPAGQWQVFHNDGAANVDWGRTSYRASTGSYSIWCAKTGPDSPGDGGDVPENTSSWAVVGPFDFSSVTDGDYGFDFYLESEENYDEFFWGASTDGSNFGGWIRSADSDGWTSRSYPLDEFLFDANQNPIPLTGESSVWFAFNYISDDSVTRPGV